MDNKMKVLCNGNDLSDAVGKVIKAVSQRSANPILEGIKLKAENGCLTLTATDLELAIEKSIVAEVKVDGEAVVPGRIFSEFVRRLNKEQIELSVSDGNRLKIRYTDSEGVLQCLPVAEYPEIMELTGAQSFYIVKNEFKDLINKIAFSVSADDSRPILKGVLLEIGNESVTGVALDGYRLAKCEKPVEKTTAMMNAVVPGRCIVEIARLLEDSDDLVKVSLQKNYMLVDLEHTRITTQLLDGDFINYRQIIPTSFETTVTVPREPFEAGLERAMLLARSDKSNLVRFDVKESMLQLSSNSDAGTITEKIPVKQVGVDLVIGFNARYFAELLKFVQATYIDIQFINPATPCVVVPKNSPEDNAKEIVEDFVYLVLPVRLN